MAMDLTIADFPLMNLNDLIIVARILKGMDVLNLQMTSKEDFLIEFAHIKLFINNYYDCLAMIDVELYLAMGRQVTVP